MFTGSAPKLICLLNNRAVKASGVLATMEDKKVDNTRATNGEKKDRIRRRIKEASSSRITVIPAEEEIDFRQDDSEKKVAVYARVSTNSEKQTSSYEMQQKYYSDLVSKYKGWKLVKIYADEGITGTSLKQREAFNEMIEDCKQGKIDIILTKSVSRFSRNIMDCIGSIRYLADLKPPVAVLFETEDINSLKIEDELRVSLQVMVAQEESRIKSASMNSSIKMRFSHGLFLTPPPLGYDKDHNGDLVVSQDEARTVRLIYYMYLSGFSTEAIAEKLTELNRHTKIGSDKWSSGSILGILKNERYYGAVLGWKTYTPNYLDHKSKRNRGKKPQYLDEEHHEPIITRDDFIAVQKMISNAKYGGNTYLPKLKVSTEGALRGFVSVNPNWGAFTAEDYRIASASAVES